MKSEILSTGFTDYWLFRKITPENIKKVAFLLTFLLIGYHGVLHLTSGVKSCKWLLSDGSFHGFGSYRVWQPYGCMLHTYSKLDARMCIKYIAYWGGRNHIVFMGDDRIHQLYVQFIQSVSLSPENMAPGGEWKNHHSDSEYNEKDLNLNIRFLWLPMVDGSMIEVFRQWNRQKDYLKPNIVIVGSAAHSIESSNGSVAALEFYHRNLTILLPYMERLNQTTKILWVLQDPVQPELLPAARKMITNERIDAYNKAAMEVLRFASSNSVHVWSSARLVAQGFTDAAEPANTGYQDSGPVDGGLRINFRSLRFSIQILLNLYCNDHMNYNDGTCCSDPEKATAIQVTVLLAFFAFIVIAFTIYIYKRYLNRPSNYHHRRYKWTRLKNDDELELVENNPDGQDDQEGLIQVQTWNTDAAALKRDLLPLMARLGIIMFYFYLCDRTNFFMKENKYFTRPNFFLPIGYVFALGLFFTEESAGHETVLHPDQTNEMKGWMQLVILAYHYTGASQVLPIYMSIRLLVSLYLFLSGFGHFTYFWTTGDVSFQRFWKVIFRLNLLAVCLCLCMNRPYQFYYFVPLITFWFIIMFATFKIMPRVSAASAEANPSHYFYLMLKMVTLFSLVSLLYTSEVFFENIFLIRPWKALFVNADDSIKEWWFRWKIDRYSVLLGMVCAFGLHMMRKHNLIFENHPYLFPARISILAMFASLVGIIFYFGLIFVCHSKSDCNELHPYVSFIPIISFVVLRNTSKVIRCRYSLLFSWFGKISLELFLCQYHIWLAADTHGILVLIPSYPVLNVVVTAFIFVCVAHEIHVITGQLVQYSISSDWRYTLRNLGIIFLILIPVGIKDGMF